MKKRDLLTVGLVVALISVGGIAPGAFAQDSNDDQQPSQAEAEATAGGVCSSGWRYIPTSRDSDTFYAIGPEYQNDNGTSNVAEVTYSSTVGATFTAAVDGSANVGVSAKLATINATFGTSLQASLYAEVGYAIKVYIPPRTTSYARYGMYQVAVKGNEQQIVGIGQVCNVVDTRWTEVTAPYKYGWNTWESAWD